MGQVFEAIQERLEKRVAIKVLRPEMASDEEMLRRFFTEAKAVSIVKHPGLVDVYEFGELDDGSAFMVMEFLEGESLHRRLARHPSGLPALTVVRLVRQVATALAATHQKDVVHRDLKPDNIMLVRDSEVQGGERCKILDFGIAKLANRADVKTRTGTVMGTPAYMSPEQCGAPGEISDRTDIYSLGIIAYELLTGLPPFAAEEAMQFVGKHMFASPPPLQAKRPDVPASLCELVHRMLAKSPSERPSAIQVVADLAKVGTTLGSQVEPTPPSDGDETKLYATEQPLNIPGPPSTLRHATGQSQRILGLRRRHLGLAAGVAALSVLLALGLRRPESPRHTIQPAKPMPAPLKWSIRSVPSGAKIFDPKTQANVGETPWSTDVADGGATRSFVLKLDGYKDSEVRLRGGVGEVVDVQLQVLPLPYAPRVSKAPHKAPPRNKIADPQTREKNASVPLFK